MSQPDADQPQYASFLRRFAATLVDTLVFSLLSIATGVLLFGPDYWHWFIDPQRDPLAGFSDMATAVDLIVPLILTILLWIRFLGTPGKLILNCHVVDAKSLGPLSVKQSVIRYFAYLLSALPLGLGFLWILWDARNRGFHDMLSGSVVILADESQKSLEELEREAL